MTDKQVNIFLLVLESFVLVQPHFLCELFQIGTDQSVPREFVVMADILWMYTQQSC